MRHPHFLVAALVAAAPFAAAAEPTKLSEADSTALVEHAKKIQTAFDKGDAEAIIGHTHPAILNFFPSQEQFEETTREAVKGLANKVKTEQSEWGTPTGVYTSGEDEVCFIPRSGVMVIEGQRAAFKSFLIAARPKGEGEWKYLDGAILRTNPKLLWRMFRGLPKDITLPENSMKLEDSSVD
jgi:hypothetical protein